DIHVLQGERNMASDNKSIGRFRLDGIAPAPRGIPQIEVTFDIDANGILNVTAKDMGTGKEQKITITASSGLSEQDIQRMVNDAKAHEAEDKAAKDKIEVKNRADSLVYQTEKQLKDLGDKVPANVKQPVEELIEKLKKDIERDDTDAMKADSKALEDKLMEIGQAVYQQQQAGGAAGGAQPGPDASAQGKKNDDGVVDAEVVDD
ncbi:MAG: Hsp70 family protein, partial [Lentisphaeria bacterium]|nr:Hsp70 family protein [Lentisphaeria bacterium]